VEKRLEERRARRDTAGRGSTQQAVLDCQRAQLYFNITFMKTQLVTNLKRNATKILSELLEDRSPILITQHGIPTAYLVDVVTFEALQNRLRLLEGIARGERAIQDNRISSHLQAKRRLRRWLR
jgi:prevent-host-death family protein